MPSLTHRIPNLQQLGPITEIVMAPSANYLNAMGIHPSAVKSIKLLAMIDTGATGTVISQGLAPNLGINPIGTTFINTPSSTNVSCQQYDLQLIFGNSVTVPSLVVTEAPLQGQHIQCLIGRDLLQHAVFIYTGYDNSFSLSF